MTLTKSSKQAQVPLIYVTVTVEWALYNCIVSRNKCVLILDGFLSTIRVMRMQPHYP
jgi:hypothetical protein